MDAETRKAWGPLIRRERAAQGLLQEDLARLAQTTRRTIGSIERGDSVGQAEVLRRILRVLGLEAGETLDRDVASFLNRIGALLQRMEAEPRERAMTLVFDYVADVATGQPTGAGPIARREREIS